MPDETRQPADDSDPHTAASEGAPPELAAMPPEEKSAESAVMTPEQLAEAKQYNRTGLVCMLADKALDLLYLGVIALLAAPPLDRWLSGWALLADAWWLRVVALFLIVIGLHIAVSFPLSYYSGHVLEHRFALSKLSFGRWLWRYTKRMLLTVAFGLVLFTGLFCLIRFTGPLWWLAAAAAFFFVSVVLAQLLVKLIAPLFYKIEKLDREDLADRLKRLAEGTGLTIEGVYRIDLSVETVKANAALAGLGRTRRVLLGDTLLNNFTTDEIVVVFAHEIGHHIFHHIRKALLLGLVVSVGAFWICDKMMGLWVAGHEGSFKYETLPVYTLPFVMFVLAVFSTLLEPLQNAVSRRFERQCDRYALERTGLKAAYVTAFRKLARQNKDDPDPHPIDVLLFHDHPPIAERLAMAEQL